MMMSVFLEVFNFLPLYRMAPPRIALSNIHCVDSQQSGVCDRLVWLSPPGEVKQILSRSKSSPSQGRCPSCFIKKKELTVMLLGRFSLADYVFVSLLGTAHLERFKIEIIWDIEPIAADWPCTSVSSQVTRIILSLSVAFFSYSISTTDPIPCRSQLSHVSYCALCFSIITKPSMRFLKPMSPEYAPRILH